MKLHGKTVLVIGLKRTGVSVARFVDSQGGRVRVADRQGRAALASELASLTPIPLDLCLETQSPRVLDGVDLVIPSPGVPRDAPLLTVAVRQNIPVWSEVELAFRFLSCPLFAVTGTNGKSTTTALLGEIMRRSGHRVFVGGNLGTPLIQAVEESYALAVAEISSFQLEWVEQFQPRIGLWLNLSADHLDRYASLAVYGLTKRVLFARQDSTDWAIVNRDDPAVWGLVQGLPGRVFSFGWSPSPEGAWIDTATLIVRHDQRETRYPLDCLRLHGRHNLENVMAAASAATLWGCSHEAIAQGINTFSGLPHRLEWIAHKHGVSYFNDSKATNVGAVQQALGSFAGPIILLAGGVDKGGDYQALRQLVRAKVKKLIVFGRARETLRATIGCETETVVVETLAEAVQEAAATARAGDTVLLSPACASFDQFHDYAHRGQVFRACVEAL